MAPLTSRMGPIDTSRNSLGVNKEKEMSYTTDTHGTSTPIVTAILTQVTRAPPMGDSPPHAVRPEAVTG